MRDEAQALLSYREAGRELQHQAFIPTRLVLSESAFDELADQLERPASPTDRLLELMRGRGGQSV